MTHQLHLHMPTKIGYSPERFSVHQGIEELVKEVKALVLQQIFSTAFIVGKPRAGKTHLALYFYDLFLKSGFVPKFVGGSDFGALLRDFSPQGFEGSPVDVFLIDDAEQYFLSTVTGNSGEFVNFIEGVRPYGGTVLFFSGCELGALPCDDHILSRLNAGSGFQISPPSEDDLFELLELMSQQRGMRLSPRKIHFLIKRLGRSIPAFDEYLSQLDYVSKEVGGPLKLELLGRVV